VPVFESTLDTPYHRKWFSEVSELTKKFQPTGVAPDRFVQSNYEGMNFLKVGIQRSGFRGREDTPKLIESLEGLEVRAGDDFPQGDKKLRKETIKHLSMSSFSISRVAGIGFAQRSRGRRRCSRHSADYGDG